MHTKKEDDNSELEQHHRVCFREDLINFLKEYGQLPLFTHEEIRKLMKEKQELNEENDRIKQEWMKR